MTEARHHTGGTKHCGSWFRGFLKILTLLLVLAAGVDWWLPRSICRGGSWDGPVTDHFDGTSFYNPDDTSDSEPPGTASFARWLSDHMDRGLYPEVERNTHRPDFKEVLADNEVEITMVNHSTMLIRYRGLNILTDPIWSDYTSPVQIGWPRRKRPVGIEWDSLPHIDVCLISHDHYDHFDAATLRRLADRDNPLFVVPLGMKSLLEYHCGRPVRVQERDWWETAELPGGLAVTLTPAHHWSRRYRTPETACRSLWCGFYIHGEGRPSVYFMGDSAACDWPKHIRTRLGTPDVALLPIGAYKPDWIRRFHQSPAEAVQAMEDLGRPQSLACHFGTWQLANEGYEETLSDLRNALQAHGIPQDRFHPLENGETYLYTAEPRDLIPNPQSLIPNP